MTTIGKICLWLNVIGLGVVSVWLLPTVGKHSNDVSANLVSSQEALDQAINNHRKNKRELLEHQYQLAKLKIGWGKSWNIQQDVNSGVEVIAGERPQLNVRGLGTDFGLIPVLDDSGQAAEPVVHAFKETSDGSIVYVGEFDVINRTATECALLPNWTVTQEELDVWSANPELPWRFRSMVPASLRIQVDQLHAQLQKLSEDYSEIEANVAQQETLLQQAKSQLEIREQELKGNPNAQPISGHPEYADGLEKAISAADEVRSDRLISVDQLRRNIKNARDTRDELLRQLDESNQRLSTVRKNQPERRGRPVGVAVSQKQR
ncbi:MAG: hypothetical protein MK102_13060 [Fuerstiella sp.]|nr:hypothetical protein [Fuerstiella sp.]